MVNNFDKCLRIILKHEGGYVNHPKDPGGMTNLGVTKRVYEDWVGHEVDEAMMRSLTEDHVAPIYEANYWNRICGNELPSGLDLTVFDFAVNSGPSRASKYLQRLVGVKEDGVIGPMTLQAVEDMIECKQHGVEHAIEEYAELRQNFYERLNTYETFGKGWTRRVNETKELSLEMV